MKAHVLVTVLSTVLLMSCSPSTTTADGGEGFGDKEAISPTEITLQIPVANGKSLAALIGGDSLKLNAAGEDLEKRICEDNGFDRCVKVAGDWICTIKMKCHWEPDCKPGQPC